MGGNTCTSQALMINPTRQNLSWESWWLPPTIQFNHQEETLPFSKSLCTITKTNMETYAVPDDQTLAHRDSHLI